MRQTDNGLSKELFRLGRKIYKYLKKCFLMEGSIVYWTVGRGGGVHVDVAYADFVDLIEDPSTAIGQRRKGLSEERVFCFDSNVRVLDLSLGLHKRFRPFVFSPRGTPEEYVCGYSFVGKTEGERAEMLRHIQGHPTFRWELVESV